MVYKRDPYKNDKTAAYVTAINILAVEYLMKTYDWNEYVRRCEQVSALDEDDLTLLFIEFDLNRHISSLGAMISQHDYDGQCEDLLWFLDHPEDRDLTR